jgi:hypothetical protein
MCRILIVASLVWLMGGISQAQAAHCGHSPECVMACTQAEATCARMCQGE